METNQKKQQTVSVSKGSVDYSQFTTSQLRPDVETFILVDL